MNVKIIVPIHLYSSPIMEMFGICAGFMNIWTEWSSYISIIFRYKTIKVVDNCKNNMFRATNFEEFG